MPKLNSYSPILFRYKIKYLTFTVAEELRGNGLNSACGKSFPDLSPQPRAELITDKPVKNSPCLLRIYQCSVNSARLLDGLLDNALCDFIENNPARSVFVNIQHMRKMP